MDHLKVDVHKMIEHVKGLISKNSNPPINLLEQQVVLLTNALEKDCINLPSNIRNIIYSSFQNILGYLINYKKIKYMDRFNCTNFLISLETISNEIDRCNNHDVITKPNDDEIHDINKAANKLWDLDINRIIPEKDYILDLQEGKNLWDECDNAPDPLFSFVDEKVFEKPTYMSFRKLLDNYHSKTGTSESFTDDQKKEIETFLHYCGETPCFKYLHLYLLIQGKTKSRNMSDFLKEVRQIWFDLYSRHGRNDSSGFEHVFVGETSDNDVIGFHNWIQLYNEERKNKFNYKGFIKPPRKNKDSNASIPTSKAQLINIGFEWMGKQKKISSSFIGVSPEFEMALYTLVFKMHENEKKVELALQLSFYAVDITCFSWNQGPLTFIATAFPVIPQLSKDEAASRIQARVRGKQTRSGKGGVSPRPRG